jgi:hypothetical protein
LTLETEVRVVTGETSGLASGACVRSGHVDIPALGTLGAIYVRSFAREAIVVTGRAGVTVFVVPYHALIADRAVITFEAVCYLTAEFTYSSIKIVIVIAANTGGFRTANCAALHSNSRTLSTSFASVHSAYCF